MMRWRDIGEAVDGAVAGVPFAIGFNLGWLALLLLSLNASNLYISVLTANLVLLGAVVSRAAWCALHAKLDALIAATPGADDALLHAEDRDEAEIRELRP